MSIAELERRGGIMQVLIELYAWKKPEPPTMSDLLKLVNVHNITLQNDIILLKRLGLVEDAKAKKLPYKHTVWLTEKGREVALHLSEVAASLGHMKLPQEDQDV